VQAAGKAKCMAHLLRTLSDLEAQQIRGAVRFPREGTHLRRRGLLLKKEHATLTRQEYAQKVDALETRLDKLLAGRSTQPDNLRMVNRLCKHRQALFTFLHHPEVDPTNNLAERQLRPAVIERKLSAGNRTQEGAYTHEVLASLSGTARQQGRSFLEMVRTILTAIPDYAFPLDGQTAPGHATSR